MGLDEERDRRRERGGGGGERIGNERGETWVEEVFQGRRRLKRDP